ncbi:MAG: MFS transporter [Halothece sp.]
MTLSRFSFLKTTFDPNFPFSPKKFPFFYGWIIAIFATVGTLFTLPGQTAGMSAFTDPVLAATGLSRVQLSSAYLIGTVGSGLLLPFGGKLIDRLGARLTVMLSAMGLGLTLVYLSLCDYLIETFNPLFPTIDRSLIGLTIMAIGFVCLRFTGQGILTLVCRNTLGKWFNRRRGFVWGIANMFISFSFSAAPLLISFVIGIFGWRGAWVFLAAVVGIGMTFLGWLFFRDNPEICGLEMDGTMANSPQEDDSPPSESYLAKLGELTANQAIKTIAFWSVTLALSLHALTVTGITFHLVDLGTQSGLNEQQAVALFLPIGVLATISGLLVGMISDRTSLKILIIIFLLLLLLGLAGIANLSILPWRIAGTVGLGVSGGFFATLSNVALPRLFGRTHLGAIGGIQMTSMVIGSAVGPSFLAWFKEMFGSYQVGLYACCLMIPIALGLSLFSQE